MSADACRNWAEKFVLKSPPLRSLQMSAQDQKRNLGRAKHDVGFVPRVEIFRVGSMSASAPSDGSVRQPLDMGPTLPQLVLDALEAAIEMIDTVDHRLPLCRKPGNYE
jgi:hypothetical protein